MSDLLMIQNLKKKAMQTISRLGYMGAAKEGTLISFVKPEIFLNRLNACENWVNKKRCSLDGQRNRTT